MQPRRVCKQPRRIDDQSSVFLIEKNTGETPVPPARLRRVSQNQHKTPLLFCGIYIPFTGAFCDYNSAVLVKHQGGMRLGRRGLIAAALPGCIGPRFAFPHAASGTSLELMSRLHRRLAFIPETVPGSTSGAFPPARHGDRGRYTHFPQ